MSALIRVALSQKELKRAKKRPPAGETKSYDFTVKATQADAPQLVQTTSGQLEDASPTRRWGPALAIGAVLALLAALCLCLACLLALGAREQLCRAVSVPALCPTGTPQPTASPTEPPPPGGPEVIIFVVNPDAIPQGGCAMLHWEVHPPGEWPVLLDGQQVPLVGEKEVCPPTTTTYELLVEAPQPQVRTVTLPVEGGPTPSPATPTGSPVGVSADVWPSDLYADNQPKGVIWVRITNNGPGTLSNKKVQISGSGTKYLRTAAEGDALSYAAVEHTLSLNPGETETINVGWQIDTSQFKYDLIVTVTAKDFTDPNTGNNTYTESVIPPAAQVVNLVLENESGNQVCHVYFRLASAQTDGDWGNDRLRSGESVAPGGTYTWQTHSGPYDLKALDCNNTELDRNMDVFLGPGTYNWEVWY